MTTTDTRDDRCHSRRGYRRRSRLGGHGHERAAAMRARVAAQRS